MAMTMSSAGIVADNIGVGAMATARPPKPAAVKVVAIISGVLLNSIWTWKAKVMTADPVPGLSGNLLVARLDTGLFPESSKAGRTSSPQPPAIESMKPATRPTPVRAK